MKLLLSLVVIAVVVVLGMPPVAGKIAENQLTGGLEQASDNGFITFNLKDYESGWSQSTGHIEVRFSDRYIELLTEIAAAEGGNDEITEGLSDALDESLLLDLTLHHGPIITTDETFIGWSEAVIQINPQDEELVALRDELEIPYFMEILAQTTFDGTTKFSAIVPPMNYLNEMGDFQFSGFQLDGVYDGVNLQTTGHTERFSVYGPAIQMEMDNLQISSQQRSHPPYLWLGVTEASIENTVMHSPAGPDDQSMKLSGIEFFSEVTLNDSGQQLDFDLNYGVETISGPDIDMSDMLIGLQLRQVDVESINKYYELNRDMVLMDPAALEARQPEIMDMLYQTLAGSPSIAMDPLQFKWNQEAFTASLNLDIQGDKLPPQDNWDPMNTMAWPEITAMQAESRIDEKLALEIAVQTLQQQILAQASPENPVTAEEALEMAEMQAPSMLEMLTLQGMLTRTETGYAAEASFRDNVLMLNGKPMPIGAALQ